MMKISKDVLRAAKPIPLLGQAAVLAASRETLNDKGAVYGGIDIGLDLIPFLGRAKGLFELFAGDLITPENIKRGINNIRSALDDIEVLLAEESGGDLKPRLEDEQEPVYPRNSAKMAVLRAKKATQPVYEKREYSGLI